MQANNNMMTDISAELDETYGTAGTEQRAKFDDETWNFYMSQILLDTRKEAKVTQSELARRINSSKSYISRGGKPQCRNLLPYHQCSWIAYRRGTFH